MFKICQIYVINASRKEAISIRAPLAPRARARARAMAFG